MISAYSVVKNKIVYLCGFMTSGKSTIGPILANVLGWSFFDLDNVIETDEGQSVVDIFKNMGESYFRNTETKTLIKLSHSEKTIVSLGGGTVSNQNNLDILCATGLLIYLKTSPAMIYKRIKNKIDRPTFRDLVLNENPEEDFLVKITNMLCEREPFYSQAAITIDTDKTAIGITVDTLVKKINRLTNEKN